LLLTLWGETTLLPEILGRKQDGFRQVALFIRRDPSSLPAFATSLYPLSFYLPGGVLPLPSQFEPSKGTLVIDQFEKRYPAKTLADFIRESEYLTEIPSGLQDHTLLCNYSLSTLETKDNPPDAIRVYRLRRKR
jgi:hypothetical protein